MKILAVSILLLIALTLALGILISRSNSGRPPSEEEHSSAIVSERLPEEYDFTKNRKKSLDELTANFPYAEERLEALYQKYPNLRPAGFKPAEGKTVVNELDRIVEEEKGDLRLPRDLSRQRRGYKEWDQEAVGEHLAEKKDLLEQLLKLSELSTDEATFRYSFFDLSPGVVNAKHAHDFLTLALGHAVRSGDGERTLQILNALKSVGEASSKPFLVNSLVGDAISQSVQKSLGKLAEAGFDVSANIHNFTAPRSTDEMFESFRRELAGTISLLEAIRKKGRPEHITEYSSAISHVPFSDEIDSDPEAQLLCKELASLKLEDFQDDYAMVVSRLLEALAQNPAVVNLSDPVLPDFEFKISDQGVSKGRALLLEQLTGPIVKTAATRMMKAEQSRRELITHSAMQQAAAAGLQVSELADLVPDYLPEVPVNSKTGEPFSINHEEDGLDFGEKL